MRRQRNFAGRHFAENGNGQFVAGARTWRFAAMLLGCLLGAVLYDKAQILLYRDLLINAEAQMNAKLRQEGPAMSRTMEEVKASMDLSAFRQKFTRGDASLDEDWDEFTNGLIKTMFEEASLR